MTTQLLNNPLSDFLVCLSRCGCDGHQDAFMNAVMENGGTYVPPASTDTSSHMFEISLHNVSAFGATEAETIRNWIISANAVAAQIEDDGFITAHPPVGGTNQQGRFQ
ncbi:hypothetical protein [Yoonia sp. I 8.24]|uniref:hypothetical protein n=1 Tax=Yoonia sp. I 8.24 TaxID=1537229 RepID=UPI001EDDC5C5|nr:hypothetical protein [Yoonia sp. I 8.24]MCG3267754.1 hypothetical protein [Yoonia sp. I 8.24]